jgi:hypothetical protein
MPAHGVLQGTPPNLVYTPQTNYVGPDMFTFVVNDGATNSASATVSVAVNEPGVGWQAWSRKMPISFPGYGRSETLSGFPVLIRLGTNVTGFTYGDVASPWGWDLRFLDGTQSAELPYEIEDWNTNGVSLVWVRIPELAGSNSQIWAYWGSAAQTDRPACTTNGAVWSNAFAGVWHLGADVRDSTANHNDGVNYGTTNAAGPAGLGRSFDGATYIQVPDADSLDVTRITEELWFKTTFADASYRRFVDKRYEAGYILCQSGGSLGRVAVYMNNNSVTTSDAKNDGAWHHLAATYNGTRETLYVDGQPVGSVDWSGSITANANPLRIGFSEYGEYYIGLADELRVASLARSSNWVWATYMTANPATHLAFTTYGAVTSVLSDWQSWQVQNFGSTSAPGGGMGDDPDHDGAVNYDEFLAGTVPTNRASVFRVSEIGQGPNGIILQWQTESGRVYAVQRSLSLAPGVWTNAPEPGATNISSGGVRVHTNLLVSPAPAFYRLNVIKP